MSSFIGHISKSLRVIWGYTSITSFWEKLKLLDALKNCSHINDTASQTYKVFMFNNDNLKDQFILDT